MSSKLVPLNVFRTVCRLTACTVFPCSKQMELKAPPDPCPNGIPYNFSLNQGKLNDPRVAEIKQNGLQILQLLTMTNDWEESGEGARDSNFPAESYFHQNAPHHGAVHQEKEISEFSWSTSLTKESSRLRSQYEDREKKWPGSNRKESRFELTRTWVEKDGPGLLKRCPPERSLDYHLFCHPKCHLVGATKNLEP